MSAGTQLESKHLLDIESLTAEEINIVLDTARAFKAVGERAIKKVPACAARRSSICSSSHPRAPASVSNWRRCGLTADVINFTAEASSLKKGETLKDTARNLEALNADIIIIRHSAAGAPHFLSRFLKGSVVNAGDGAHEHPTQALLDTFTIREKKGRIEGLNVTILGDILYSRVARSNIWALTKLGAQGDAVRSSTLVPALFEQMGCRVTYDVEEAIARRGHHQSAPHPARASAQDDVSEHRRVHQPFRPEQGALRAHETRRADHASGPHQPRRGNQQRNRRLRTLCFSNKSPTAWPSAWPCFSSSTAEKGPVNLQPDRPSAGGGVIRVSLRHWFSELAAPSFGSTLRMRCSMMRLDEPHEHPHRAFRFRCRQYRRWTLAGGASGTKPLTVTGDLSAQMVLGIDKFLMREIDRSTEQRARLWTRDFSSPAAYEKSIAPNRERFRKIIGAADERTPVRALEFICLGTNSAVIAESDRFTTYVVRWPVFEGLFAEGLLLEPKNSPRGTNCCAPGRGQTPADCRSLRQAWFPKLQFARRLAENGCQVFVPTLIDRQDTWSGSATLSRFTNQPHREWIYRQAFEMGRHIIGYEVQKVLARWTGFESAVKAEQRQSSSNRRGGLRRGRADRLLRCGPRPAHRRRAGQRLLRQPRQRLGRSRSTATSSACCASSVTRRSPAWSRPARWSSNTASAPKVDGPPTPRDGPQRRRPGQVADAGVQHGG